MKEVDCMNKTISQINKLLFQELGQINTEEDFKKLEQLLLAILQYDQRKYKQKYVFDLKVKTKNWPVKFKEIYPNQIFEIYLENIDRFAYGVIVGGNFKENRDDDIIIGYLNHFSSEQLSVDQIFEFIRLKHFLFFANSGLYSIINYRWKFVGSFPSEILNQDELQKLEYSTKFLGKYYKSVGNSVRPILECEIISEEEASHIMNPLGIIGDKEIENILEDYYKSSHTSSFI